MFNVLMKTLLKEEQNVIKLSSQVMFPIYIFKLVSAHRMVYSVIGRISSYLDKIMAPIVRSLPSYVKDSQHALQIFRHFNFLGEDKLIFTMDISYLYTVIPNGECLLALKHFFDLRTFKEPSSETLLRMAELVLTLNCFSFATSYYKQINGVAIDTKMGPNYANLFVGYIEHHFFIQYNGPKPELYRRYIDDCVGATSSTREELNQFITAVNSFHPALKYTWEISNTF